MQKQRDSILTQQVDNLQNAYDVSLNRFKIISDNVSGTISDRKDILDLLYKAKHSKDEKFLSKIRKNLFIKMEAPFKRLQKQGVLITLFAFENNKTFLRMHKPEKFNDDLSKIRYSFTYVNSLKKPIRGFEQGKISHAFRNIYPIFYKNEFLGSIDIAFSSDVLQEHMEILHDTNTHFILNKKLLDVTIWKMPKMVKYIQSLEHKNFLYSISEENQENEYTSLEVNLNKKLKKDIYQNVQHGDSFALEHNANIVAFLPIHNLKEGKTVAYLVSYSNNKHLKSLFNKYLWINVLSFIVLALISLVVYNNAKKRFLVNIDLKKEVEDQNKAFKIIFEKASDGILIFENDLVTQCNEAVVEMFGYKNKNQIVGQKPSDLSSEFNLDHNTGSFEMQFKTTAEEEIWLGVTLTTINLKNKKIIHALLKNISVQKEFEHKAFHDTLTKLPNRALFNDRLHQSIKSANRHDESFALMFIDLDKFKPINDSLWHQIGDAVLKEVAKRLKSLTREEDTISRIGGDEFTIIMQKVKSIDNISILGENILTALKAPIHVDKHILNISASIGVSIYPAHSTNFEKLIECADIAMYKAKKEGRNNIQIYSHNINLQGAELNG